MIDFHSHILPGIDDGSPDVNTSLELLQEEARQGIDTIVFTPHFYAERMPVERFFTRREAAYRRLVDAAGTDVPGEDALSIGQKTIAVYKGAEVAYFRGMGRADAIPRLCVEGTDTILVEMPFAQWDSAVLSDIEDILYGQNRRIVIAHVERYFDFQKSKEIWNRVFDLPVTPQINAGTFTGGGIFSKAAKKKKWALAFIEKHPEFILGSDCHNLTSRRPNMETAVQTLTADSRFGQRQVDLCMRTALTHLKMLK